MFAHDESAGVLKVCIVTSHYEMPHLPERGGFVNARAAPAGVTPRSGARPALTPAPPATSEYLLPKRLSAHRTRSRTNNGKNNFRDESSGKMLGAYRAPAITAPH
ncbi:hypothetical protein EVAR_88504_1 [Eumeta japonica]|uniref:Uncharacterized protein n=1 Tax=Eumeta variegata TaxID=151549 RepID=A0A4C1XUY8_EUMVA|nr:hypothetical protein EVAR_88504_1 [Eumeta japonica]